MPVIMISLYSCFSSFFALFSICSSGNERERPRAYGTIQYAQKLSQPSWIFNSARVRTVGN